MTNNSNASTTGTTEVTIKSLLDVGAHYGHQAQRWNPKMLPNIYTERNKIHVINLDQTLLAWNKAKKYIVDTVARGGNIMIVGTKPQARAAVEQHARRSGSFFVASRWLGGTLSNFETMKRAIERMRKLEEFLQKADQPDSQVKVSKKEKLMISRELEKLVANLGGIRDMRRLPDVLFVVDVVKEAIAVNEARRLRIPVIALVDTNADPDKIDFPIPCNDDATRTLDLMCAAAADAVLEGRKVFESRIQANEQARAQKIADRAAQAEAAPVAAAE